MRFLHAPARYLELMREALPLYDRLEDEVVRATEGLVVTRLLDLGVGTGETTRRCLEAHPDARAVGIDASPDMLAVAATVLDSRVELRVARLEDPLPDGPFELIVSALAVHHLDGPGKADIFRRIRERLAPGGRFVMADVVVADEPVSAATPLVPEVDKPDRLDDMLDWLAQAGLGPTVCWAEQDLVVVAASLGEHDLSQFDPFRADVQADLTAWFRALRRQEPVHYNEATGYWFVTSHEAILEALHEPNVFSSGMEEAFKTQPPPDAADDVARIRARGWKRVPALLYLDPPAHDRQRALIGKAFTTRIVRALEPDVALIVDGLLDDLVREQPADFVSGFAVPLPALVIARMLNVAPDRLDDFKRWADARAGAVGRRPTSEEYLRIAEDEVELQRYFVAELDKRRAEPQDDLLTAMLQARLGADDGIEGEPLSLEECLAILSVLLAAGIETTTNLLGATMRQLGDHPELWEWLRDDPVPRTAQLVEEALRIVSPVKALPRITTTDAVLDGVTIAAGAVVFLVYAAANRDEACFPDPDTFDCARDNARQHLAFGHGRHFCLGAPLARLETTVTWRRMVERFEAPVLSSRNTFAQRPGFVVPGLEELFVELTARS